MKSQRKCAKCGCGTNDARRFHRFPVPGSTNILRARAWASYCWPDKDWSEVESLKAIHRKGSCLCSDHFQDSCYIDSNRKTLSMHAVPGSPEYVVELLNTLRSNIPSMVKQISSSEHLSTADPLNQEKTERYTCQYIQSVRPTCNNDLDVGPSWAIVTETSSQNTPSDAPIGQVNVLKADTTTEKVTGPTCENNLDVEPLTIATETSGQINTPSVGQTSRVNVFKADTTTEKVTGPTCETDLDLDLDVEPSWGIENERSDQNTASVGRISHINVFKADTTTKQVELNKPKSTFAARERFFEAKRAKGESVENWAVRLMKLSIYCDFGNEVDMLLVNRFVLGMDAGPERDCLFEEEPATLTLEKAIELAQKASDPQHKDPLI